MPIPYKITRYGCQFKCGTRRRSTEKKATMHENICWYNPENKTCKTCKHEKVVYDSCDHPELESGISEMWVNRECESKEGAVHLDSMYESLKNEKVGHVSPVTNCPFWEPKND